MIKLICIKNNFSVNEKIDPEFTYVYKWNFYYALNEEFYSKDLSIINIFICIDGKYQLFDTFSKELFFDIKEWREEQLNKILEDE